MTAHAQVRLAAAAAAWVGLAVGATVAPTLWWAALLAAGCAVALWTSRRALRQPAPLVVVVVCVLLVVEGRSIPAAAFVGVTLLVHVVLADLLDHSPGATRESARAAAHELGPALSLGAAAGLAVALAGSLVGSLAGGVGGLGEPWSTALRLGAPFALLVGVLLALGLGTRRPGWALVDARGLSALTRRYLDRVPERH